MSVAQLNIARHSMPEQENNRRQMVCRRIESGLVAERFSKEPQPIGQSGKGGHY
jgi:hypothetical protein